MLLQCGSRPTHGERTGGDVISCSRLCVETALKKKKNLLHQQKDVWFDPEKVFKEPENTYRTAVSVVPSFFVVVVFFFYA